MCEDMKCSCTITDKHDVINYRRIPSNELDAKSTTPLAGRVITPTRPLPMPEPPPTTPPLLLLLL